MTNLRWIFLGLTASTACQTSPRATSESLPSTAVSAATAAVPVVAGGNAAQNQLDRLDARTPVPLLPMMAHHQKQNMRDHLAAVQEIVAAVAKNDFSSVEKSASRMGFSETMKQMCTHMGAGTPGFAEAAIGFHKDADKISEAARKRDAALVLSSLGQTLSHCTGCHETYKQHIVDESVWSAASGGRPPPHPVNH